MGLSFEMLLHNHDGLEKGDQNQDVDVSGVSHKQASSALLVYISVLEHVQFCS